MLRRWRWRSMPPAGVTIRPLARWRSPDGSPLELRAVAALRRGGAWGAAASVPLRVFDLTRANALVQAMTGDAVGTLISA